MKRFRWMALILAAGLALPALAGGVDGDAVLGGALGGAAGAAVGSAVGGRNGAIVGGAIGGAAGAAIATDGKPRETTTVKRDVVYVDEDRHHDHGLHRGWHKHEHRHRRERRDDD